MNNLREVDFGKNKNKLDGGFIKAFYSKNEHGRALNIFFQT